VGASHVRATRYFFVARIELSNASGRKRDAGAVTDTLNAFSHMPHNSRCLLHRPHHIETFSPSWLPLILLTSFAEVVEMFETFGFSPYRIPVFLDAPRNVEGSSQVKLNLFAAALLVSTPRFRGGEGATLLKLILTGVPSETFPRHRRLEVQRIGATA
jgi:hypothetical protein